MGKSKHCTSETNKTKTQANANIYPSYSNYEGASHADTRTRNWKAPILGPNIEFNEWEQYSLIARSRDLYRNFPLIHACIDRMIDYIIGTGIKFQPRLRNEDFPDYSPEELLKISRDIKEKFYVWGESCGVDSRFSFFELQRQIAFSMLVSGECFWNSTFINDKLRIQLFEPERVSLPDNQIETKFLRRGLKFDEYGENIGFYVEKQNSYDGILDNISWEYVPRFGSSTGFCRAGQIAKISRPEQIRGIPLLASVIIPSKELAEYLGSEQAAAKISSFFTVFIKKTTPTNGFGFTSEVHNENKSIQKADIPPLAPAAIIELLENEDISLANPTRPSSQFSKFIQTVSTYICASLGIPYELVVMLFQSSYSASRASFCAFQNTVEVWQKILENKFLWYVFELWLRDYLVINGYISNFQSPQAERWLQGIWIPPAIHTIEPVADIEAAEKRVEAGFSTVQRETEQLTGEDINDLLSQEQSQGLNQTQNQNESDNDEDNKKSHD